ncbi:MAG: hypothetical protein HC874_30425 [Richelia sp. SL_2_1]|nr:hypothetical protein [Richelia sp. SL_2_1]
MKNLKTVNDIKGFIDNLISEKTVFPISIYKLRISGPGEGKAINIFSHDDIKYGISSTYDTLNYYNGINNTTGYYETPFRHTYRVNVAKYGEEFPLSTFRQFLAAIKSNGGNKFWTKLYFEFSRDLDWEPGTFGDGGSCYFGGKTGARHMILNNGGFAVKVYSDKSKRSPIGRMWGVVTKDGLITWNGYTTKSATLSVIFPNQSYHYIYSLFLAKYMKLAMKPIDLYNNGYTNSTLHINSGGILLTPKSSKIYKYDFNWTNADLHRCNYCGYVSYTASDFEFSLDGYTACSHRGCAEKVFDICNHDLQTYKNTNLIVGPDGKKYYMYNIMRILAFVKLYNNTWAFREDCKSLTKSSGDVLWIPKTFKRKLCPGCDELIYSGKKLCKQCENKLIMEDKLADKFRTIKFTVSGIRK